MTPRGYFRIHHLHNDEPQKPKAALRLPPDSRAEQPQPLRQPGGYVRAGIGRLIPHVCTAVGYRKFGPRVVFAVG